jgi:hypothetical protein
LVLRRAARGMVLAANSSAVINVETLHPVEIKHAYKVFSFRLMILVVYWRHAGRCARSGA